jgi:hypothetical protein
MAVVVHGIRFPEMPEKSASPPSAPRQEMAAAASSSASGAALCCWAGSSPQSPENNQRKYGCHQKGKQLVQCCDEVWASKRLAFSALVNWTNASVNSCTGSVSFYLYRTGSTQRPSHDTTDHTAIRASKRHAEPTGSPPTFLSHCKRAHQLQNLEMALKSEKQINAVSQLPN